MKRGGPALLWALSLGAAALAGPLEPPKAPDEVQASSPVQPPAGRPAEPAREVAPADVVALPTKDLFDVLRDLRHKPPPPVPGPDDYKNWMIAAAPVLTYGPTTGFGIGVAGNMAVYKGLPANTRISSLVASVTGTTKEQLLINAKINASTRRNTWHLEGDNRLQWTSQKTYGFGSDTPEGAAVDQKYDFFRFYETLYRTIGRNGYLGAGFLYNTHTDVRPADDGASAAWPDSPYLTYSERNGFDPASQTSAGFSVNALYDDRDGPINPSRGWYANATYRLFFKGFLGGTSDWRQFSYDLRTYFRLSRNARHKVAVWLSGDFVTAGTAPYLDLPATGTDTYGRAGRGYPAGRFRGEDLVYGEVEYRWTVTKNGLIGLVTFLNTQTLSNDESGEKLFDHFATGAGLGLRVMLNKRSQTNLCFDVGFGKDGSTAVYFAVQEAF